MPSWRDIIGGKFQSAKDFTRKKIKGKIIECGPETVTGKDKEEKTQLFLRLNNHEKLFALNVRNCNALSKKWGDNYEKWIGKFVEISVIDTEMAGEDVKGFKMNPIGK